MFWCSGLGELYGCYGWESRFEHFARKEVHDAMKRGAWHDVDEETALC